MLATIEDDKLVLTIVSGMLTIKVSIDTDDREPYLIECLNEFLSQCREDEACDIDICKCWPSSTTCRFEYSDGKVIIVWKYLERGSNSLSVTVPFVEIEAILAKALRLLRECV